ncbi:LytR/AlgR family response regulator transcription factor [Maribellus sediminis]|uniref:LytR/AlgR family response regulator transcription factor n=1 Tax=Maribellus sediminis TaxID=2696285 RepID=UPI001430DD79|nr:LytTR family DNA-binding domain-containing protein [Maribellus sediminis]
MPDKINAIIVDDEQEAIDYLSILLKENCPHVELLATCTNSDDAVRRIDMYQPDLVFMDIQIDHRNGFDVVKEIKPQNQEPHIIFVTAYDRYAVEAFKANATDYLLKPVEKDELVRAVKKYAGFSKNQVDLEYIQRLIGKAPSKLRFNTRNGYILVNPDEIVYCQADGNYTELFLQDNSKKLISYNLRTLFAQLPGNSFKRISRFHAINEKFLREVDRGKHQCLLQNGAQKVTLSYSPKIFFD